MLQQILTDADIKRHISPSLLKNRCSIEECRQLFYGKKKKQRKTQKRVVLPTSLETLPFVDWLISSLNFVRFSTVSV